MYCCRLAAAVWNFGCCDFTVRSSAYDIRCVFGSVGRGMSCMKRLKSVGESTEPCGPPFVKCFVGDGLPLYFYLFCCSCCSSFSRSQLNGTGAVSRLLVVRLQS